MKLSNPAYGFRDSPGRNSGPASLGELLGGISHELLAGSLDVPVRGVHYHSGRVKPGYLFVAIKGMRADGHDFVSEALRKGATSVVLERDMPVSPGITKVTVADSRLALSEISARFFGHPSLELTLIGITGTNGKTTVAHLIDAILLAWGKCAGVLGTIGHRFGKRSFKAEVTTPESLDLHGMLRQMLDEGVTHAVMEVSSHALDLKRVAALAFDVAAFTNISRDHLDFHHDMESYFGCKKTLFTRLLKEKKGPKKPRAVLFFDDERIRDIIRELDYPVLTFGLNTDADVTVTEAVVSLEGSRAEVRTPGGSFELNTKLLGWVNLLNHLAAAAVGLALGADLGTIKTGLESISGVPGRLERVESDSGPTVLVDYAHTPEGLENVINSLAELGPAKLITVFGCGGDRDRGKRPEMGRIAAQMSDLAIVTSDNPRSEPPASIIEEIEAGIRPLGLARVRPSLNLGMALKRAYALEPDRRKAIEVAVSWAVPGDVVLIAGKGHEDYQIVGDRRIPFLDRAEALRALRSFWGAV